MPLGMRIPLGPCSCPTRWFAAALLLTTSLAWVPPEAFANKTSLRVQNRAERLERVEAEQDEKVRVETEAWLPARVRLNLYHRVPVVEAVGYCALMAENTQPIEPFLARARAIQAELDRLAGERQVVGRDLPPSLDRDLTQLRSQLYTAIQEHFGPATLSTFRQNLNRQRNSLKPRGDTLVAFRDF